MASISQLTARLVDLFGAPSTANPAKLLNNLGVAPSGNVVVGAATSTDTTTNKLQVSGGIAVSSYDTGAYSQFRAVQGNYGAMIRNDGTTCYLLSTASGAQYGTWNAYRPFSWNLTTGAVGICSDGSTATIGGPTVLSYTTGTASPALSFNANGYAPLIRSNSTTSNLEVVNSANTALNLTINDGGLVTFPRARPTWAGLTPWDNGNFTPGSYMPLTGGTITGALVTQGLLSPQGGSDAVWQRANGSYAAGTNGLTSQGCVMSWNDGTGTGQGLLACNQGGGAGGWVLRTVNSNNTSEIGRFVISGAGVGTNGSDIRLKDNVETITDALDKIRSIRGVSYSYKSNGEKHYGVIAQEVQPYFPDAVTITHTADDPGNFEKHEDLLGVSYNDLIGPLIEAVKELADKVDTQAQQIAKLQEQLGKQ